MKRKLDDAQVTNRDHKYDDDINVNLDDETFKQHELARYESKVHDILRLKPQENILQKACAMILFIDIY
jgi:hypothetical protein